MRDLRLFRPLDGVLIGLIAVAALLGIWARPSAPGVSAEIIRDGTRCVTIDLTDPERHTYTFDGAYPLTIVAENGAVWFAEASCPDRVCVQSGKLTRAGESAACLPAGIVVRICGASSPAADGITG